MTSIVIRECNSGSHSERLQATERARARLLGHLNAQQQDDVTRYGWFFVTSQFEHVYRISLSGRVADITSTSDHIRYCLVMRHVWLPVEDQALIKKLLLETDEHRFLSTATRL